MKNRFPRQIVVTSSNKSDTPVDIEEKLQKAVSTIKQQQESRQIPDIFLKTQHHTSAKIVDKVMTSMLDEIAGILTGGESGT